MGDLTIPDEAWDAVLAATATAPFGSRADQQAAVDAAAPLIVAAELERIAEKLDKQVKASRALGGTNYAEGKADGIEVTATGLRRRAAELRGGVSGTGGQP